eukprot:TRINITY_DN5603_c0_g1_i3.p1 TRINITY_DN5603_c0_g1~~TRINITY_DN5603_c0_g1_i3.p1  ORF type:complete len:331 (+),score=48.08 TRINITY_DN5603_c0_g1_i3:51-1043(+)
MEEQSLPKGEQSSLETLSTQSNETSSNFTVREFGKGDQENFRIRANYLNRLGLRNLAPPPFDPREWMEAPRKETNSEDEVRQANINKDLTLEDQFSSGDLSLNVMIAKSHDEVRRSYLSKLMNMGIINDKPSKKEQTVIIFDWDDTLICTTYLSCSGYIEYPMEDIPELRNLNNSAARLLELATTYSDVYIITNAAQGWVEYSAKTFLPKVAEVLSRHKIKVVSARTTYEQKFPGDFYKWKVEAFLEVKKKLDKNVITNLICLGDSHIEIDAAHILAKQFNQSLIKTIKFRESPRPDELQKQQELVIEKIETIFIALRNLTIRLEKKTNG